MGTGVQLYTSADSGAPQLYGASGKLRDVIKACVVSGYGSGGSARTPAGTGFGGAWTEAYVSGDRSAFRPSAGNQFYLRVRDDGGGTGGAKEALVRSFETMSDVNTGTNGMPTSGQSSLTDNSWVVRKSQTADSTNARPWIVIADDRSIIMLVLTGDSANTYFGWCWGDIFSYLNADGYRTHIMARVLENSVSTTAESFHTVQTSNQSGSVGHYVQRSRSGSAGSVQVNKNIGPGLQLALSGTATTGIGSFTNPRPNTEDSLDYLLPLFIHETTPNLRGIVRGLWFGLQDKAGYNDGDTFDGTGDLAGKSFRVVKSILGSGYIVVETSDTWATSS